MRMGSLFFWMNKLVITSTNVTNEPLNKHKENVSLSKIERILFLLCILIYLLPIWSFEYFPSQDGPSHLANAAIISEYHKLNGWFWREYYYLNDWTAPTWLNHLMIVGLLQFLPPLFAEKVLLSGYIVGIVIAFYYCLRCFNLRSGFCIFLIFPILYNYLFLAGYYSFSYSVILFLLTIGYFARYKYNFGLVKYATFFLLAALTYLLHPSSFGCAAIFIIVLCFFDAAKEFQVKTQPTNKKIIDISRRFTPIAIVLPVIICSMYFVISRGIAFRTRTSGDLFSIGKDFLYLPVETLISFSKVELLPLFLFCLLILFILWRSGRALISKDNQDRFVFVIVMVYVIIYLVIRGEYIETRVALLAIYVFLLWISSNSNLWCFRPGLGIAIFLISILLVSIHCQKFAELNSYLSEYLSSSYRIESNTTLLPLSYAHFGQTKEGQKISLRVQPFLHASSLIVVTRHINTLNNYEATRGYFPVVFRDQYNPYKFIGNIDASPPSIKSLRFPNAKNSRIDYILIWGLVADMKDDQKVKPTMEMVEEYYDLIFVSSPRGITQLWRRKDDI